MIQIGTCNGLDEFHQLCESQAERCTILLVEPNAKLIGNIKSNYLSLSNKHDINIINCAIVNSEEIKSIELYFTERDGLEGLSSLIQRRTYELKSSTIVEAITLNSLLDRFNIKTVDELHIDAEGMDYNIMLSLDIEKYDFKLITCEIWPYDNDDLNSRFETGPVLLKKVMKKYSSYMISETTIGDMPSLKFVKPRNIYVA